MLAIAGLIFLMVFIGIPTLQKSQRDKQRMNDVGHILAALEKYRTNNNGRYPGTARTGKNKGRACFMDGGSCETLKELNDFLDRYVTDDISDPSSGQPYHFAAAGISGSSCREQVNKMSEGGNLYNFYGRAGLVMCYETKCDGKMTKATDRNTVTIYYNQEIGGMVCREI